MGTFKLEKSVIRSTRPIDAAPKVDYTHLIESNDFLASNKLKIRLPELLYNTSPSRIVALVVG